MKAPFREMPAGGSGWQKDIFFYFIIFWVLRTLRYQWQSCGKLRKYGKWVPAKELCSLDSRKPFKKGSILNF